MVTDKTKAKIGKVGHYIYKALEIFWYANLLLLDCGSTPVHQKPSLETKVVQEFKTNDTNNVNRNNVNYVIGDSNATSYFNHKENYMEEVK